MTSASGSTDFSSLAGAPGAAGALLAAGGGIAAPSRSFSMTSPIGSTTFEWYSGVVGAIAVIAGPCDADWAVAGAALSANEGGA